MTGYARVTIRDAVAGNTLAQVEGYEEDAQAQAAEELSDCIDAAMSDGGVKTLTVNVTRWEE